MSNQRLVPYLVYVDAPAALDFLCTAFGFKEKFRYPMDDGRIGHAEPTLNGDVALMVASSFPELGLVSPRDLPGVHSQVKCLSTTSMGTTRWRDRRARLSCPNPRPSTASVVTARSISKAIDGCSGNPF